MAAVPDTKKDVPLGIDGDEDPDDVLAALEDEDDPAYRQQRLREMHEESRSAATTKSASAAPVSYITLKSDPDALQFTTEHERAVLHFFHPDFARCSRMDNHLRRIADKTTQEGNLDVAYARVDVNHASFIVEKLAVRVLPCIVVFIKGIVKGRVTGFEGLCWDGNESSPAVAKALEKNLIEWNILKRQVLDDAEDESGDESNAHQYRKNAAADQRRRGIRDRNHTTLDEDDDDWD